jgi:predicted alpha/beta-hydrolase family hydrolase
VKSGPFAIPFEGIDLPAVGYVAKGAQATYLFAHGAGAPQKHPYIVGVAKRLVDRCVSVITFDFPYTAQARKVPDSNAVLEGAMRAVLDAAKTRADGALFAGGKSMGGRIASQVVAKDASGVAGLVFLGYPLHPPGKPDQRRDAHLPNVKVPMLFVQGTRDVFGTPAEIAPYLPKLAKGTRIFAVEDGDHSHAVLKRSGMDQSAVEANIADAVVGFIREHTG